MDCCRQTCREGEALTEGRVFILASSVPPQVDLLDGYTQHNLFNNALSLSEFPFAVDPSRSFKPNLPCNGMLDSDIALHHSLTM